MCWHRKLHSAFLHTAKICVFFAATHFLCDYTATCIDARHTGNMPGVRIGGLKDNGKGFRVVSTATLGLLHSVVSV